MDNLRLRELTPEPSADLVKSAITKVLEIAQKQGITADDFVHMLDSGMRITDFLKAMEVEDVTGDGCSRFSIENRSRRNFS
jgi:hypothetical protein